MFANEHGGGLHARMTRRANRVNAKRFDAEERIEAARDKRARRAEKRLRDSQASEIGQMKAREALERGIPRGNWYLGLHTHLEPDATASYSVSGGSGGVVGSSVRGPHQTALSPCAPRTEIGQRQSRERLTGEAFSSARIVDAVLA